MRVSSSTQRPNPARSETPDGAAGDERLALNAYDAGAVDDLSEGNRFKKILEQHGWGVHLKPRVRSCPACRRDRRSSEAAALAETVRAPSTPPLARP